MILPGGGADGENRTRDLPITNRLHYRCATSAPCGAYSREIGTFLAPAARGGLDGLALVGMAAYALDAFRDGRHATR